MVYVQNLRFIPENIKYYFHDHMSQGERFVRYIKVASPKSECIGIIHDFVDCYDAASKNFANIISTHPGAPDMDYEIPGGGRVYFTPLPEGNHASYLRFMRDHVPNEVLDEMSESSLEAMEFPESVLEDVLFRWGILKLNGNMIQYDRTYYPFFDKSFIEKNNNNISVIIDALSDAKSVGAFCCLIYGNPLKLVRNYIDNIFESVQYFDRLNIQDNSVVIDCGVDTGWEFPYLYADKSKSPITYAIDPLGDKNLNSSALYITQKSTVKEKIHIIKKAVWSEDGHLSFNSMEKSVKLTDDGTPNSESIPCIKIDTLANDIGLSKVDIVKMDLEGAELHALRGMKDVIKNHRPQIAVAMYHSIEHMIEVPIFLINETNGLGYNYYMDTYFLDSGESIFYCIPKENDKNRTYTTTIPTWIKSRMPIYFDN